MLLLFYFHFILLYLRISYTISEAVCTGPSGDQLLADEIEFITSFFFHTSLQADDAEVEREGVKPRTLGHITSLYQSHYTRPKQPDHFHSSDPVHRSTG